MTRCTWSAPPCRRPAVSGHHCTAHAKLAAEIDASMATARTRMEEARNRRARA